MARFNKRIVSNVPNTKNLAGGSAYTESPKLELVSILLTSFVKDQYYRKADDTSDRLRELVAIDPLFAAKAAIYARNTFGMRSITHVVGAEIAKLVKGQQWTRRFYEKVIHRPDDMTETMALYISRYGKRPIPHCLRDGLAKAFDKFDAYQIGKYQGKDREVSLIDVINIVRPVPTEKNGEALRTLAKGETLKSSGTWESKLSEAGTKSKDKEEVKELKGAAWKELLFNNKLGYFALLRNLVNIIEQAPDCLEMACDQLVDEKSIKKSLVLPFRFKTAFDEVKKLSLSQSRRVQLALNTAMERSCANVPVLGGKTLIALDGSGSMFGQPMDIATLFAAVLLKSQDCDVVIFSSRATWAKVNPVDSVFTIAESLKSQCPGGGTNMASVFTALGNKAYDRLIVLSDMQSWEHGYSMPKYYNGYCQTIGSKPKLYSWDLAGYGSLQFPEDGVYCLAGFSNEVFSLMQTLEQDPQAMLSAIEAIEL